jgi:hypothetical protein
MKLQEENNKLRSQLLTNNITVVALEAKVEEF